MITIKSYLSGKILKEVDGADLQGADLQGANLRGANLQGANLRGANLRGANLQGANLRGADLQGANLQGANLQGANLRGANLQGADLQGANLQGANLQGANLRGANLREAKEIPDYVKSITCILPDGDIIGWKNCNGDIVQLKIPAKAKRSNATGRKCRAEYAIVLKISKSKTKTFTCEHGPKTEYTVGKKVKPDSFDADRWNECSNGIHFFITKQEAIDYI